MTTKSPPIGVVVVAFNSAGVILGCVESLLAQEGGAPAVIVVDNASTDDTVAVLRDWASRKGTEVREFAAADRPSRDAAGAVTLVHSGANRGFAGGVNVGLALLAAMPETAHFWVLNPDAYADPGACRAILRQAEHDLLTVPEQLVVVLAATTGVLDDVPVERVAEAEAALRRAVTADMPELGPRLASGEKLGDEERERLLALARSASTPFRA